MRRTLALLTLVSLVALLSACGGGGAEPATTTTEPPSGGRVAVGDPISVADALVAPTDRPHLVRGYLFQYPDGSMVIADAILESFPPQPGGATATLIGFSLEGMTGVQTGPAGGAISAWTDLPVEVLGTMVDGVLTYFDNPSA